MLRKLYRDERGQVIIMFTIMVPVILGMIGLALEGGQLMMLHSQMQNLADAAAIAGANELDHASDAITRATAAADTWSQKNNPWWSNVALSGVQITDPPIFYSVLKGDIDPSNGKIASSDVTTTDPTQARYIKVITVARGVAPAFLVAVGAVQTGFARATATASSTFVACKVQPLMLCNPNDPAPFSASAGDLFGFTVSQKQGWSPGDFSLLDPVGQTNAGAGDIENLLSDASPPLIKILRHPRRRAKGQRHIALRRQRGRTPAV